jgi:hypothetical protein
MTTTLRTLAALAAIAALALLTGCGNGFPDEEMHLGLEDKIRPYAVVCEPPEAAPGETVTVTLRYFAPRPAAVVPAWRVVLDYDQGLYEADEIERRHLDLAGLPAPAADAQGFATQSFTYTVPDSTLWWSSAIPETLTDEVMLALTAALGLPPRKDAVAAYLSALTADDLAAMDPEQSAAAQRLADVFACQIRLRATLADGMTVDVTRNLTVRHSRRLGSANANANAVITRFVIGSVPVIDLDLDQLEEHAGEITWHEFDGVSPDGLPQAQVTVDPGRTYFASVRFAPELYTSPYDVVRELQEQGSYRWFYFRLDAPGSGHRLLATDEGEDAEAWDLDEDVRLLPPGGDSSFRVMAVVRDERVEWARYHAVPGQSVAVGVVVFLAPQSSQQQ